MKFQTINLIITILQPLNINNKQTIEIIINNLFYTHLPSLIFHPHALLKPHPHRHPNRPPPRLHHPLRKESILNK
jgi:hypothetical protein